MSLGLLRLIRDGDAGEDRSGILDAALAAFLDYGIRRTSMAEVARRGGLSPATLYRRFAQKADLVQAVILREASRFVTSVDRRVDQTAGAEDQIVDMYVAFLDGLRGQRLLSRLLSTEPDVVLPLLTVDGAALLGVGRDYLGEFIGRLQQEGKLPPFEPAPVAEMIARVALSLALTKETRIPVDDEEASRRFARVHIAAVFGLS